MIKNLTFAILFSFLFFGGVFAQMDIKKIKNPKSTSLNDYHNILKEDIGLSNYNSNSLKPSDYKKFLNNEFDFAKSNYFKVVKSDSDNSSIWLQGYADNLKSPDPMANIAEWTNKAFDFLKLSAEEFGFIVTASWTDDLQQFHVKMNQSFNDIPVYGSEFIVHSKSGRPFSMNGKLTTNAQFASNKTATIGKQEIKDILIQEFPKYKDNALDLDILGENHEVSQWEINLVYYPVHEKSYELAYHVKVYPNLAEHYEYFVSATNGMILDKFSTICNFHHRTEEGTSNHHCNHEVPNTFRPSDMAHLNSNPITDGPATSQATDLNGDMRLINTYEVDDIFFMIDASRQMFNSGQSSFPNDAQGVIWTIDLNNTSPINDNSLYTHIVSDNNNWNNSPEGVSAHFNGGSAYEYFRSTFNRNSISGTGQSILSFVNVVDEYENSMGNAFWNGIGIYYGNGDAFFNPLGRGLDVAGHEMSHGVIESTANLEYRNESGAMNEAFADIFGAMIDRDNWTIGEDVVKLSAFPSGALRNMADPHNGASTGDFNSGWQPKHYDERYIGSLDNGGVHWNSGIINHAFYLFAQQVGQDVAEQVFYRALSTYLIRSSEFKELRYAVVQSSLDLYSNAVAQDAREAFNQVGILDESESEVDEELDINPGDDLLLVSDQNLKTLYIFNLQTGDAIFNPLSTTELISKPSITDDGTRIIFVGVDNHIHLIDIDWTQNPPVAQEQIVSQSADWRNAVISKDGRFIALLENVVDNKIIVIDLLTSDFNEFILTNPTYSSGVNTGEVQYADVMEFDASGTSIMYDAYNRLDGNTGTLEFWDIGFLEFWNPQFDTWALGSIEKLFSSLPEGINIANPTFSKNSPYIIAIDIFDGFEFEILGINLETQDFNSIYPNSGLAYPSFSRDDAFLIFDLEIIGYTDLGILQLTDDKIGRVANSDQILLAGGKWGTWFSNGERMLTSSNIQDFESSQIYVSPNPVSELLTVQFDSNTFTEGRVNIRIFDLHGKSIYYHNSSLSGSNNFTIDMSAFEKGMYILELSSFNHRWTQKVVKQ